jgi:mannose-6-phosphate isomerase class I
MAGFVSNYDRFPAIAAKDFSAECVQGWDEICRTLNNFAKGKKIIALECYVGLHDDEILQQLRSKLDGDIVATAGYMLSRKQIEELVYPDVTDDELYGYITRLRLNNFFDEEKLAEFNAQLNGRPLFIYGPGAAIVAQKYDGLVYFDMPRWEGQLRFRRNEVSNLGVDNKTTKASLQYKQAFYVDWRVCDRQKKQLISEWDFVVDTASTQQPKMATGRAVRGAYQQAIRQPFRLVPFFDPGPWGGQWMKKHCNLDPNVQNYAWCFDCVPEENSLLIDFNGVMFETPSINLVFAHGKELLGDAVHARFGDEFPIRFDFLDTIHGGNLSLQVHPTNEYIRENFGMAYTQDESYYILDAKAGAKVYLGLKENIEPAQMIRELQHAQDNAAQFDAEKFVATFPAKKHDHFLIPAGTVHCSGKDSMVLEISATPYMFTFKLYDWGRMGLDGKPRPINIKRGEEVINWARTENVVRKELVNRFVTVATGDGWTEEKTGLHETEFIETRRHWFNNKVQHFTNGSVNVLNLVEGDEVIVESPAGLFQPFVVHYAETFVVPANVNEYTIRPIGKSEGKKCSTMKAFVRFRA